MKNDMFSSLGAQDQRACNIFPSESSLNVTSLSCSERETSHMNSVDLKKIYIIVKKSIESLHKLYC